jgi:hypothetical protein
VGAAQADQIIVIAKDDAVALGRLSAVFALAEKRPRRLRELVVRIMLETPEVISQVRAADLARRIAVIDHDKAPDLRVWNPDEIAARHALRATHLDWRHSFAQPDGTTELFCIGFGSAGSMLASAALRLAHHVDTRPCKITVVDQHAARSVARFRASHPSLEGLATIESLAGDAYDVPVIDMLRERLADPARNVVVSVAIGDVDHNLTIALMIQRALKDLPVARAPMPIFVRQSGTTEVGFLFDRLGASKSRSVTKLVRWGGLDDACRPEQVIGLGGAIDERAVRVHAAFLRSFPVRPQDEANPLSVRREWHDLWWFFREDARNRADFLTARLRSIGLAIDGTSSHLDSGVASQLTQYEAEVLAKLEHRRWFVSHFLAGWTKGDRDEGSRTDPKLRPWRDLNEAEREFFDARSDIEASLAEHERIARV